MEGEAYMAKRITAVLLMGIFLVIGVEAAMVSFLVIETGLPQEVALSQHSERWENALLDVFFDAGHIVSNSVPLRLETKPSGEIQKTVEADIEEARNGGVDYFIIAQLDFTPDLQIPGEISFTLLKITPYEKIYEKQVTGKTYRSVREEIDDLRIIVRELVPYLNTM